MKTILGSRRDQSLAILSIFLITAALIAGILGCIPLTSEIQDWYDLDAVRGNLSGSYILMNDLDSTTAGYEELASPTANGGKGWEPIGTSGDQFTGSFNGQGYEIRDFFINRPDEIHVGLFGEVGQEGVIKDIGVMNVTVIGDYYVGGLVGYNYKGTVNNSYSSGNVTGEDDVGGLVGYSRGTVSYSYSTGSVTGEDDVGGLVGYSQGTVSYSYSTGRVIGDYYAGGLVGYNYYGTVSNSYSSGNMTGDSYVGGLVGYNHDGTLINSYSTGRVSGNWNVGGLVAWSYYGNGSNSFWDRETSGQTKSAEGTGKTTAQMKSIATFWGAGWNIIPVANPCTRKPLSIWNIVDDQTYPFLSWQT